MAVSAAAQLAPLIPILGRWRTTGTVLDEDGNPAAEISGSDVYDLLPGGHWIAHEVDVRIGGEQTVLHEVIGGTHRDGGWQMHAFEGPDGPGLMRLTQEAPGVLVLHGDGVRSRLRAGETGDSMTARWERLVDGRWLSWMEMRFDRR